MITLQTLTPTQSTIIRSAARHPEGKIAGPATLQGGAREYPQGVVAAWLDRRD